MKIKIVITIIFLGFWNGVLSKEKYADQIFAQGVSDWRNGKYELAIELFDKTEQLYFQEKQWRKYVESINNKASVLRSSGQYQKSEYEAKRAIVKSDTWLGKNNLEAAMAYNTLGVINRHLTNYALALEFSQKSLAIRTLRAPNDPILLSKSHNNIAILYSVMGEYDLAIKFFTRAMNLRLKVLGPKDVLLTNTYNNLGSVYLEKGIYDSSLIYNQKALAIRKETIGDHPITGNSLNNVGACYEMIGDFANALSYYEQALKIFELIFVERHPLMTSTSINIGDAYAKQGNLEMALQYYQAALISASIQFADTSVYQNPSILDTFNQSDFLIPLMSKAVMFEQLHDVKGDVQYLQAAREAIQVYDRIAGEMRDKQQNDSDMIILGERSKKGYEIGVRVSIKLFESTKEVRYEKQAFYFSERARLGALTHALSSLTAKDFGSIPAGLLDLERTLKFNRSKYESKILRSARGLDSGAHRRVQLLRDSLFTTNRRYDSLIGLLEKNYPSYYRLKYDAELASVPEIQSNLNNNTALIEYFFGDETIYIFGISEKQFVVRKVAVDTTFRSNLQDYLDLLRNPDPVQRSIENYDRFVNLSYGLYSTLITPLGEGFGQENLILIPDGILSLLPFESLISELPDDARSGYQSLNYLIRQCNISYGNSGTAQFRNMESRGKDADINLLAFAPSFEEASHGMDTLKSERSMLMPLLWAEREVKAIAGYFDSDVYVDSMATELVFNAEAGKHQIVHIASHSFIDNENPMYSKIAFAEVGNEGVTDGYLHTFELFNSELNAELAVLSACNTGLGVIKSGEGVMSLGYAFTYAGVPSTVMSYWTVDDKSTYRLMNWFYTNLSDGKDKNKALTEAKLNLLSMDNGVYSHPYYWSAFVLYGSTERIVDPSGKATYIIAVLIALLFVGFFILKKKLKNNVNDLILIS